MPIIGWRLYADHGMAPYGRSLTTLKYWMKNRSKHAAVVIPEKEKRPQDWTADEQLMALQQTYGLTEDALQSWCRERGLFGHHLTSWRTAFCAGGKEVAPTSGEMRNLKDENAELKRAILRKDKALAEAAALLILQKKFNALWEDEEK